MRHNWFYNPRDFGNVHADRAGKTGEIISDQMATLFGDFSTIGRCILVHKGVYDLYRGNSSDCDIIGKA